MSTPVQFIKGVGPHRAELLAKLGINSTTDLLFYLPRTHQDRRLRSIEELTPGQKASIKVDILTASFRQVGPRLGQVRALVQDGKKTLEALWFRHLTYKFDVFS